MRKIVMWNLMTLDGFFEGTNHDISWHEDVWGEELERFSIDQCREAGMLLFGRVTYDLMAGYWPSEDGEVADLMNSLPKAVASRTLAKADWNNTRLIGDDAPEQVARLKGEPGKDIFVFGSADLAASLIPRGLIDEFRICVCPLILGGGTPLFKQGPEPMKLRLLDSRPLKSGAVIHRYRPA